MLVGLAMDARAMTEIFATGHETVTLLAGSAAWLAVGGLVGAFHFLTLRLSTRMLVTGSSLPLTLAFHLIRFAGTAGALVVIARHGALPLLAAALGILASRTAVLRPDLSPMSAPRASR
jgi:F1F0 ATPase subunit 2